MEELKREDMVGCFVKNEGELIGMIRCWWRGVVDLEMERRKVVNIFVT
ncbi:hypothetical protein [Bacillus altitudinis]|nr:hypothetical protein [Bacillus altitudinis]